MTQLYAQASQQGIWTCLGPPQSAAFALGQALVVTYGDGTQDTLSAHVPAVTSAGTTQVDRTAAVWLLYVVHGDPTLRIVREMDQGAIAGSYAALARVLADRVVPYQPDNGQAQSSTSGQSFLPLTVQNNSGTQSIGGSTVVPVASSGTDYVVQCHLSGGTASAVWNALADKTTASDVQVLFAGAEIDADIDQLTNGAWSSSNQTLWFRLQRPIAASGTDQGYQLRMGGAPRSSPPRSWANIYPLADDFSGSSLDSTKWTNPAGTATVSGSFCSVSNSGVNGGIRSAATFGTGYAVSMRGHLPPQPNASTYAEIGWTNNTQVAWLAAGDEAGVQSWAAQTINVTQTQTAIGASDSSIHLFFAARRSDGAIVCSVDSGAEATDASPLVTLALPLALNVDGRLGGTASADADWIKLRPYVSPEPTCSAGTLQSAGALRWEPVVDATGSVLIAQSGDPIMALVAGS